MQGAHGVHITGICDLLVELTAKLLINITSYNSACKSGYITGN